LPLPAGLLPRGAAGRAAQGLLARVGRVRPRVVRLLHGLPPAHGPERLLGLARAPRHRGDGTRGGRDGGGAAWRARAPERPDPAPFLRAARLAAALPARSPAAPPRRRGEKRPRGRRPTPPRPRLGARGHARGLRLRLWLARSAGATREPRGHELRAPTGVVLRVALRARQVRGRPRVDPKPAPPRGRRRPAPRAALPRPGFPGPTPGLGRGGP